MPYSQIIFMEKIKHKLIPIKLKQFSLPSRRRNHEKPVHRNSACKTACVKRAFDIYKSDSSRQQDINDDEPIIVHEGYTPQQNKTFDDKIHYTYGFYPKYSNKAKTSIRSYTENDQEAEIGSKKYLFRKKRGSNTSMNIEQSLIIKSDTIVAASQENKSKLSNAISKDQRKSNGWVPLKANIHKKKIYTHKKQKNNSQQIQSKSPSKQPMPPQCSKQNLKNSNIQASHSIDKLSQHFQKSSYMYIQQIQKQPQQQSKKKQKKILNFKRKNAVIPSVIKRNPNNSIQFRIEAWNNDIQTYQLFELI